MSYDKFKTRVDALPVASISLRDLSLRIQIIDAELESLAWDEVHIESETHGIEKLRHIKAIEKERREAKTLRANLSEELKKRTA